MWSFVQRGCNQRGIQVGHQQPESGIIIKISKLVYTISHTTNTAADREAERDMQAASRGACMKQTLNGICKVSGGACGPVVACALVGRIDRERGDCALASR